MNPKELINIIIIVTVFVLVLSVWCICVFLWLGKYLVRLKSIQKRLGIVGEESDESKTLRLWRDIQESTNESAKDKEEKLSLNERMERLRTDAGWKAPLHIVILGLIGIALLVFMGAYIISTRILVGFVAMLVVFMIFSSLTKRRCAQHEALFERQLLDALGIASRALRAGHPLVSAFQLVSEEIADPLGSIFYRICREQELGLNLEDSVYKEARLSRNTEMKLLATSIVIQSRSGGNFADLMDSLSSIIRSRVRLNKRIRITTAQTQFSKKILIALPIFIFFLLHIINPEYMEPLRNDPLGQGLLVLAVVNLIIGSWMMNKLSKVNF